MLQAEQNWAKKFRYHTSLSLPRMQASKFIQYWNLRLTEMNGRKVSPTVLGKVRLEAGLKDFTTTKEHIIVERNLTWTKMKDIIKVAETLREK